ncbi:zinc phosphodiesterase ELAC protein 1-like isoform X1 [Lethenteron reissneri]|uniref:zinc phosphodiesterase ELAC protein 1-like isoform X1 n=1 Tax=Lethenteron reissneri TaxID=7753 RepID=UPI002AB78837|nr:zinc phosphodiesterase ELAC protein 1-like isoform X1 [Lethenteron reissneri]
MSLEVTALGTGAAFPSPRRGTSAVALRLPDGSVWLFDCGEGTQTQLMRSPLKPGRVTKIFITHLHGDHVFGLPGLMCSLSMLAFGTADAAAPPDEEAPAEGPRVTAGPPQLEVFGPVGLRRLLRVALQLSRSQLGFRFAVHELRPSAQQWSAADSGDWRPPEEAEGAPHPQEEPGREITEGPPQEEGFLVLEGGPGAPSVRAFPLRHCVPSFGYAVREPPRAGRLHVEVLRGLGVPPGPLYGRLKAGEAVTLPSGRVLLPGEVADPPVPGRLVAVFGDCSEPLGPAALRLCQGADLLVHEATLEDGLQEKARLRGHSTPSGAAATALACGAHRLLLTHLSQRYRPGGPEAARLREQAEARIALAGDGARCQVTLAEDLMVVDVPLRQQQQQR